MTRKGRRLVLIGVGLAVLGLAAGLILTALNDTIVFFRTPTEVAEHKVAPGTRTRLGGLVETGSLVKDGASVRFAVTDGNARVTIAYTGILPDLFREGQGVVAEGAVQPDGLFKADTVLAKHDEKYMPREVADALKQQGHWMEEAQQAKPGTADGPAKPKPAAATPAAATPPAAKPVSVPPGSLTQ